MADSRSQVSAEQLSGALAERLNDYLDAHPDRTLQDVADAVGVSATTVSRWRNRQGNVAILHAEALLQELGLEWADLAADLNVEELGREQLPQIKVRGARRKSAPRPSRPAPTGSEAIRSVLSVPNRLLTVSFCVRPQQHAAAVDRAQQNWKECFDQDPIENSGASPEAARGDQDTFRFGREPTVVLTADLGRSAAPSDLLSALRATAGEHDLVIVHIGGTIVKQGQRLVLHGQPEPYPLADFIDPLQTFPCPRILVLECFWRDAGGSLSGPEAPEFRQPLQEAAEMGLTVVAAALPAESGTIGQWPFLGKLWSEGTASGRADQNGDGLITLQELCQYAHGILRPLNLEALTRIASGQPATVVPLVRLFAAPHTPLPVLASKGTDR